MDALIDVAALVVGAAVIVRGAETFAGHLAAASGRLGVTTFGLAPLLAGAEPEELATAVAATVRDSPAIAYGDVIGANAAICLVALGVGARVAPLPVGPRVRRYALLGLPVGASGEAFSWDGRAGRGEGALLVGLYVVYVAAPSGCESGGRRHRGRGGAHDVGEGGPRTRAGRGRRRRRGEPPRVRWRLLASETRMESCPRRCQQSASSSSTSNTGYR